MLSPHRTSTAAWLAKGARNPALFPRSEITAEGKRVTKLDQILLNGNNVALVRPPPRPTRRCMQMSGLRFCLQLVPGGNPAYDS